MLQRYKKYGETQEFFLKYDCLCVGKTVTSHPNSDETSRRRTYTHKDCIDSLAHADIAPLTKLQRVVLPTTLEAIDDDTFREAENLR